MPEAFQSGSVKSVERYSAVCAVSIAFLIVAAFAWQVVTAFRLRYTEKTLASLVACKATRDEIVANVREASHHERAPLPDEGSGG